MCQKRKRLWSRLYLHQLRASHAMATLLSRLSPSNTWGFISINQAPLRTLSYQSKRGLVVLGRLFSGIIHCCSVAIPSTCVCVCCKLFCSWCLPYNMGARSDQIRFWGIANDACAAMQRLYDYYLKSICLLTPSTSCRLLLTELGLLPLQVVWWRQTLQFWNV